MKEMLTKDFLPAVSSYAATVSDNALAMKALAPSVPTASAESLVASLGDAYEKISSTLTTLDEEIQEIDKKGSMQESADYCHKTVLATMDELRAVADKAEAKIPDEELPYPTYDALLFSV